MKGKEQVGQSPAFSFWSLPPCAQRLVPLPLSTILCEATLLLCESHKTSLRHVYIANAALWYSPVTPTQTVNDRRIRRWADLGTVSVRAFQEVHRGKLRFGLALVAVDSAAVEVYFPCEDLMVAWLGKFEQFCRLHCFQDDYRVLHKLGSGHFGTVSAALEHCSGLTYAVKAVARTQRQQLDQEIAILKEIDCSNVPKVRKVYEDQQKIYVVMQLAPGLDISNYLSRFGPLSEALTRKVAFHLTRTLVHLHQQSLIHRDLKPANVLIDIRHSSELSSVFLVDFGLAIRCDQARAGSCSGTAGYLAPELIQLEEFDCKVDVFSLGVLTFTMIAGDGPFASSTVRRVAYLNSRCKLSFTGAVWKHISSDCIAFITALTAADPRHRPSAAQALCLPWLCDLQQQYEELALEKVTKEGTPDSLVSTQSE